MTFSHVHGIVAARSFFIRGKGDILGCIAQGTGVVTPGTSLFRESTLDPTAGDRHIGMGDVATSLHVGVDQDVDYTISDSSLLVGAPGAGASVTNSSAAIGIGALVADNRSLAIGRVFGSGSALTASTPANRGGALAHGNSDGPNTLVTATEDGAHAHGRADNAGSIGALGVGSLAHGEADSGGITASATGASAFGFVTAVGAVTAQGNASMASGIANAGSVLANNDAAVASGHATSSGVVQASGDASYARGRADGVGSLVEASGTASLALGSVTGGVTMSASARGAVCVGLSDLGGGSASANGAFIAGRMNNTTASGVGSFCIGDTVDTQTDGDASFALGNVNDVDLAGTASGAIGLVDACNLSASANGTVIVSATGYDDSETVGAVDNQTVVSSVRLNSRMAGVPTRSHPLITTVIVAGEDPPTGSDLSGLVAPVGSLATVRMSNSSETGLFINTDGSDTWAEIFTT